MGGARSVSCLGAFVAPATDAVVVARAMGARAASSGMKILRECSYSDVGVCGCPSPPWRRHWSAHAALPYPKSSSSAGQHQFLFVVCRSRGESPYKPSVSVIDGGIRGGYFPS
jgi:hypothetical protein